MLSSDYNEPICSKKMKKFKCFVTITVIIIFIYNSCIEIVNGFCFHSYYSSNYTSAQGKKTRKKEEEEYLGKKFVIFTVVSLLAFVHYFVEIVLFFLLSIGLVFFCLLGKSFCLWALTPLLLHWSFNVAENLAKKNTHIHTQRGLRFYFVHSSFLHHSLFIFSVIHFLRFLFQRSYVPSCFPIVPMCSGSKWIMALWLKRLIDFNTILMR